MPGRTKDLLLVVAAIAAVTGTAGPAGAHKPQKPATPPPTANAPTGPLAYYLMSGNQIVSPPYDNVADCFKDLTKVKHNLEPGSDTLVCVHRRP